MDDDDYGPYGTKLGKLSTGIMSDEDFKALAQSFRSPTVFLDAVEDFLKRVHTVFEQKQISEDGESTFFKKPNSGNVAGFLLSMELGSVIKAWHVASILNQEVASFNIETLEELKSVISRENEDILTAFCVANEELSIHRTVHELPERGSSENGNKQIPAKVAQDPPPPFLGLVFNHDSTVKRIGYEDNLPIQLAPQRLKLLKFVHDAGAKGRTQSEIVPDIIKENRILASEKDRLKVDLLTLDIDLGPRSQYVVRCTRIANEKPV